MKTIRIALAQINSTVGDIWGNAQKISDAIAHAKDNQADMVVFPELAVTGYPPEDLLLNPQFIRDNVMATEKIAQGCVGITAIVGFVDHQQDIYNAAACMNEGQIRFVCHKHYLPNYGVFDENRYFRAGQTASLLNLNGVLVGVNICEDIWYPQGPAHVQAFRGGAELIVNLSASPYYSGKSSVREEMLATRAKDNITLIAYVNLVGGQDELIFDGGSMVVDEKGRMFERGKQFSEDMIICDLPLDPVFRARLHDPRWRKEKEYESTIPLERWTFVANKPTQTPLPERRVVSRSVTPFSGLEEVYRALVFGLKEYGSKNRFQKALLGLSGGIDSALTAVIACEAFGKENVVGVFMPSRYTSPESHEDVRQLADNIGIRLITLSIEPLFETYLSTLSVEFGSGPHDTTEENLQSRIRGNILMGLSNKFGSLVLTTGNKSEMSVGYTTLYGDMVGGFAVIKDVWKTVVYDLARHYNQNHDNKNNGYLIPDHIFTRPPTAELRPNQSDQDTLPPYDVLDAILKEYVEGGKGFEEIVALGFDAETVEKIVVQVNASEFKRRQAPIGTKITSRAFGKDRRMPITHHYQEGQPQNKIHVTTFQEER